MAVLTPYMEKIGVNTNLLELTPRTGQGIIVENIQVVSPSTRDFLTVRIGKTTVGFFQIAPTIFNHLTLHRHAVPNLSILEYLTLYDINTTYPVREDETLTLESNENMTIIKITYRITDAADITPELPNGSFSKEYFFLNYGTNSEELTLSQYYTLDKTLCPVEFPDFPFAAIVPAKTQIQILGILFNEYEKNNYADTTNHYHHTSRLRLIRGRETLFDEDKNGWYVKGGGAAAGSVNEKYGAGLSQLPWYSEAQHGEPLLLEPPLIFLPGDELNVQVLVGEEATISIPANKIAVAIIEKVTAIA